jgi:hypothetical protein
MKQVSRWLSWVSFPLAAVAALLAHGATSGPQQALEAVEGLWAYTSLQSPGGPEQALTGVILFKDGMFAQHSIFDAAPLEKQVAMAHAGPYRAGPSGVRLVAQQTIRVTPDAEQPLSFRRDTQHDLSVERAGDAMTVVFGTGTIQKFRRIGPANGTIHSLENGMLAWIDGHFVLVEGTEQGIVTGFGTYERAGSSYDLQVTQWAEASGAKVSYARNRSMKATFDGRTLTLAGGKRFKVKSSRGGAS